MELLDVIMQRRSIRKYTEKRVPRDVITQIIQAGIWAPSACNVQGWRFIVIDEKKRLEQILPHGAASFLKDVHQAILVLYDNQTDNIEYKDHIQSASAGIQNMLLRAYELQVGTCWINFLPRKRILHKLFSIPHFYEPIALISLGYYDSSKIRHQARKQDAAHHVSYNQYQFDDEPTPVSSRCRLFFRRIGRKIYFMMPNKKIVTKKIDQAEKKFDN